MFSKLGRKLTNDEFDLRLKKTNFRRIDNYENSKTPIRFSCNHCNKILKKKPKEINKLRCTCLDKSEDYQKNIFNKNIILLENYKNMRTKLKHLCLNCSLVFLSSPKSILSSKIGCTSCSGKIFSIDKYKLLLPNNLILLDNIYTGSNKYHRHKCLECLNEFKTKPNYIIHMGTNCPFCNKSKGERKIVDFLNRNNLKYETEYPLKISNKILRFDFYIVNLEIFIEYDGIQHFKPVLIFGGEESYIKQIEHDRLKDKWCLENNKKLVRIAHFENIEDILNKEIYR